MTAVPLRVALFSGNYNYVRDGANQALNRLVGYLLRQGAIVRIYSPTTSTPAFEPVGELVSVPSLPFPGNRGEYRWSLGMPATTRRDIDAFGPSIIHVSAPDILGHRAVSYARAKGIPVVASMHTRFETYLRYYGLDWLTPSLQVILRRFYSRCDAVFAPNPSMAHLMRDEGMGGRDMRIWARGIDTTIFNPAQRDLGWRRSLGIADDEVVIGFLGRLVMEKGLDVVAESLIQLSKSGARHRQLIIGDGPARDWLQAQLPDAVFAGFLTGSQLGKAVASMDVMFNPSVTEAFGNVMLEAIASGVPVVATDATGSRDIVRDGATGHLVAAGDITGFTAALASYCGDGSLRAAHGQAALADSRNYDWDEVNSVVWECYQELMP